MKEKASSDNILWVDFETWGKYKNNLKAFKNIQSQINERIQQGNELEIASACIWMEEYDMFVVPVSWTLARLVGWDGALLIGTLLKMWSLKRGRIPEPEHGNLVFKIPMSTLRKMFDWNQNKLDDVLTALFLRNLVYHTKIADPKDKRKKQLVLEVDVEMLRKHGIAEWAVAMGVPLRLVPELGSVDRGPIFLTIPAPRVNTPALDGIIHETEMLLSEGPEGEIVKQWLDLEEEEDEEDLL